MSTTHFDIVPTMDHAPKGKGPPTVLATDKGAESDQYAEVDHSMDSAAAWNELNTKFNSKTKSTATLEIEPTGRPSKQTTAATVANSRKKSKDPNGAFAEPAHPTTQPRPSCIPPRMLVTELPRAASPCDDTGDYWKNERAIYEQSKTTPDAGRVIKGVIRPSKEPSEEVEMPPSKKQRTAKTRTDPQSKSGQSNTKDTADPTDSCDADDEHESIAQSGFDEELRTEGQIVDPTTGAVIVRVIPESGYKHHLGLTCGGLSSGVMKIEPDCEKPNRLAHAGTLIFYVTKGRVAVTINSSTFAVTIGGQFMVPRGNQYSIKNVGREDSIIFYARAKAHETEPVLAPDERKDGKRKRGNTERFVKDTKARNKKQLPPPSPEPSPEVPSQSSPEPTTVVTKKGRSTKKLVRSQK
ncbi:Centromere protein C [Podila horticola]|nr:Centromere protein C [Podila horticola]